MPTKAFWTNSARRADFQLEEPNGNMYVKFIAGHNAN
jgi:hypothetical protein